MVAIKNLAIFSTIAAVVMAAPSAPANEIAARDSSELTTAELEAIVNENYGLEKRDLNNVVNVVLDLVGDIVNFLGQTLSNVLSLNLSAESDSLTNLLIAINNEILKLVNALGDIGVLGGLGGLLQKALINTGVAGLVLSLSSTVSTLVAKILKNGGQLSDSQKAAFTTLQASITALYNTLQAKGLGSGVLGTLQNILNQLGSVL